MVITCEQCQARFRLADEKLKPEGTKVRCTKCKHVFTVFSPEAATVSAPGPGDGEGFAQTPPPAQPPEPTPVPEMAAPPAVEPSAVAAAPPATTDMELDFSGLEQSLGPGRGSADVTEEFSFADTASAAAELSAEEGLAPEPPDATGSGEFSAGYAQGPDELDFDTTFAESDEPPAAIAPPVGPAEFAFDQELASGETIEIAPEGATFDYPAGPESPLPGEISFADEAEGSAPGAIDFAAEPGTATPGEFELSAEPASPGASDFQFGTGEAVSGLSEFGFETEAGAGMPAITAEAPPAEEPVGLEFGSGDSFESSALSEAPAFGEAESAWDQPDQSEGLSFDFDEPNFETKNQERISKGREEAGLSFGEIDFSGGGEGKAPEFGSEPDFSQASMAPTPEPIPVAPPPPPPPRPEARRPHSGEFAPPPQPRQRAKPRALGIVVLLAILCGAGGYLYVSGYAQRLVDSVLLKVKGEAPPAPVEQLIALNISSSSYVKNREAGQLLVVQGTVTNNFPDSRSAISVKGVLLDATGKVLQQQTVFCGNYLNEEKLRSLRYAQIEEAMNNQFGESLSNMNVAAGKALPFTIVFRNVPKEMANINVEVVDSKPGGS